LNKIFVLDTNVLLHDPNSIYSFGKNTVVIPIYVLEELDNFKKDVSELGRNAREVARNLDIHRTHGSLQKGVHLRNGGVLKVLFATSDKLHKSMANSNLMDNKILSVAVNLKSSEKKSIVVFVTKDTNLRIRADTIGLNAEDYETDKVEVDELYSGSVKVETDRATIDALYKGEPIVCEDKIPPNGFVQFTDGTRTAIARNVNDNYIVVPREARDGVWGVKPRNPEQVMLMDLLLDDSVKLVTVVGNAGGGKTLLSIAAALHKVTEEDQYQKVTISRPVIPMGKDIGFLPGSMEEKLNPWVQPIFDNIDYLISASDKKRGNRGAEELINLGVLEVLSLTHIRGRTLPNQIMIFDEVQNTSIHELKTIITRAGEGTKIILTGDPQQIDNPYVDSTSNGLVYVVNKFKNEKIAGHVTLTKGERSELAEIATKIL